ncbi:Mini-ribonuclease 3 [Papillibacter cinnamivorans]|uniref:Mini-ribonuclease 3 n=1 Tax=Papillibacter cinnamivorans DSM 12816 TaxID=1122930 RepID=A0A1W1YIW3_9FIRM|nr:ribonuclease III domain-containing protein [Papillibacter cinnamivorans]SMC36107.1 ribonuclease-3 family protein [Papillibacter cinnamivorans DSM 12816]
MTDYLDLRLNEDAVRSISTLGLAYLGDAVFELMVRSRLCLEGKATSGKLHKAAVSRVSAPAQAAAARRLLPLLSEEEQAVFRRGRNANVHAVPKNASREDYQTATALETLFGWLYLHGRRGRLNELFENILRDEEAGK